MQREAEEEAHLTNPVEYAPTVLRARHQMAIEVSPDLEKRRVLYQQKIDGLEKSNQSLLDRLVETNRNTGSAGGTIDGQLVEKTVEDRLVRPQKESQRTLSSGKLVIITRYATVL